jgi:hypothetical protein
MDKGRRPLLAYAAIGGAIVLTLWALTLPRLVHGQSKSQSKLAVPIAQGQATATTNATANTMTVPKSTETKMSQAERQNLRSQIIEASKQANRKPAAASNNAAVAAKKG